MSIALLSRVGSIPARLGTLETIHEEKTLDDQGFALQGADLMAGLLERRIARARRSARIRQPYKHGIYECIGRNALKGFCFGSLGSLLLWFIRKGDGRPFDLWHHASYGKAFAAFLAIFNTTMYVTRSSGWLTHELGRVHGRGALAGGTAGLAAVLMVPERDRISLGLAALVRIGEVGLITSSHRGWLPVPAWGGEGTAKVALFALSISYLLWAWTFARNTMEPSYLRFMDDHGQRLGLALRTAMRRHEAVHTPVSAKLWAYFFASASRKATTIYFPLYFLPVLPLAAAVQRTSAESEMAALALQAQHAATNVIRSSAFLACSSTASLAAVHALWRSDRGSARRLPRWLALVVGGFCGSLGLLFEKPGSRQTEYVLFSISQSIRSIGSLALGASWGSAPVTGTVLFTICSAVFGQCFVEWPYLMRADYLRVLSHFLDSSARRHSTAVAYVR